MKTMKASEFKAKCLQVMDEVAATGESVQITKHGKPVARLVPDRQFEKDIVGSMKGTIFIPDDLDLDLIDHSEDWGPLADIPGAPDKPHAS